MTDVLHTETDAPTQETPPEPTGAEVELMTALRHWRFEEAQRRMVRPYVIFPNTTLRALALLRPATTEALGQVFGMGKQRCEQFGVALLTCLHAECARLGLPLVARLPARIRPKREPQAPRVDTFALACEAFRQGLSLEEACMRSGRKPATVEDYLVRWATRERPVDLSPWLEPQTREAVQRVAAQTGRERLRPIYEALGGHVPYVAIRLSLLEI